MTGTARLASLALDLRLVRYAAAEVAALRDVALEVHAGEIVGIVGHVGAGKTTLALAAAGLLGGSIPAAIEGHASRAGGLADGRAAILFSNPWTQLTELGGTVEEEVAVGPENLALPRAEIAGRVDRALRLAGAEALAARVPSELSGGELQRVALASALALALPADGSASGALLVLDEPTAQLDPGASRDLAARLRALAADGMAILLVEQDLDIVAAAAHRVIVLADGAPLAQGEPRAVLGHWPPLDERLGAPEAIEERHRPIPPRPAPAAERVLELTAIEAGYGERSVLRGVSLDVRYGAASAWLGANGAGKTTLARTVMGLVPGARGEVRVGGQSLAGRPVEERARSVGLVFQDPARQLFARNVLDEVSVAPRAFGATAAEARRMAREALDEMGLGGEERTHPRDLAPQAQRLVAIAAAAAARPPLLVLDEPTAGQDAAGRAAIGRALEAQRARGGAVVITHDLAFARRWCDDAVLLAGGRVAARGPAVELTRELTR